MGSDDSSYDDQRGYGRGLHRNGETLNYVGAMPGGGRFCDAQNRPVVSSCVVFGHPNEQAGNGEADKPAIVKIASGEVTTAGRNFRVHTDHEIGDRPQQNDR